MAPVSHIDRLDDVLKWFAQEDNAYTSFTTEKIVSGLFSTYPYFKERHYLPKMYQCLEKLRHDGFIKIASVFHSEGVVSHTTEEQEITIKGLVWLEQNGYRGEADRNNLAERRAQGNYILTKILAVGVVIPSIYYLIEIAKHHISSFDLTVLTSLVVLIIGIGMGTIATLLIQEVLTRRTR